MSKTILITGGTGTFGSRLINTISKNKNFKKIIIFSRDETKQFDLKQKYSSNKDFFNKLRFFIGDVRDKERIHKALKGVDIVVHSAALKHISATEYNPDECIKTNILGSQNLIDSCVISNVKKCLLISTDKAVNPVNLYGATKLCAEKLFISANYLGLSKTKFSVLRYGNVFESRGSIFEIIKRKKDIKITDPNMTRFHLSQNEAINCSILSLQNMIGGEIFVPKLKSYRLGHLLKIYKDKKFSLIGKQRGEKIHESLISNDESMNIFENKKFYILTNNKNYKKMKKIVIQNYNSGTASSLLNISEFKKILKKNNEIS